MKGLVGERWLDRFQFGKRTLEMIDKTLLLFLLFLLLLTMKTVFHKKYILLIKEFFKKLSMGLVFGL